MVLSLKKLRAKALDFLKPRVDGVTAQTPEPVGIFVNDLHSRLNKTRVERVVSPGSIDEVQALIQQTKAEGRAVCIVGGRHAMGGQQFARDSILLDTQKLNRVIHFDPERGLIKVEAGCRWPELLHWLERTQARTPAQWGIRQKQTGADRLSIGGALSANAHGRGLLLRPIIDDVESMTLVDSNGKVLTCGRKENDELFRLVIGGYGLFGVIADVTLRLAPRQKMERVVEIIGVDELIPAIERRIADGFLYGDFQFTIDPEHDDFLRKGVFSCYRPIEITAEIPGHQKELTTQDWMRLFYLAHKNKTRAFEEYATYYLSTHGQRYWSDTHQLSEYVDEYHRQLDEWLGPSGKGSEMITEIYVPRESLISFMEDVRKEFRKRQVNLIYGTVRFIEKDDESFLAWAKQRYVCIVFNLHTAHDPQALSKTAAAFRLLIDHGIRRGGSYYLTYHRWATRAQVETCYPRFIEFLRRKSHYDPNGRFQSEWYRHYVKMFADSL
jgi:FAD/FMN-containing dehydrogenase